MTQVKLQPYSKWWKWLFLKEKLLLKVACGRALHVQHVGSTSIRGMVAKPIIDILAAVADLEQAWTCIDPIERLGYEYRGENSQLRQHYYVKGHPDAYHLYVLEAHSQTWKARLAFRDHIRQHPDAARRYAELKLRLANHFAHDLRAYQDGKEAFVEQIVRQAQLMSGS